MELECRTDGGRRRSDGRRWQKAGGSRDRVADAVSAGSLLRPSHHAQQLRETAFNALPPGCSSPTKDETEKDVPRKQVVVPGSGRTHRTSHQKHLTPRPAKTRVQRTSIRMQSPASRVSPTKITPKMKQRRTPRKQMVAADTACQQS